MKKTLSIIVVFLAISTESFAQREKGDKYEKGDKESKERINVPAAIKGALSKKYPTAIKVTWEKENGNYEANWGGKSGEDNSVQYTPAGDFIEIVHAIPVSQLPPTVYAYIKQHYKGAKITEAGRVTDAKGKIFYEAEVKGRDIVFDEKGNFVKAE